MPIGLLLTADETAERLRVCPATLSRLVRTGELPAPVYVGRQRRFVESMLSDWLREQTQGADRKSAA